MNSKLHVISSGSKANAVVVETPGGMLLVDQGLSFKRFKERCGELGIDPFEIKAIVVTHEHSDHINGVPFTSHKLGIPVFATAATVPLIEKKNKYPITITAIEKDTKISYMGIKFTAFPIMHDAVDPVGYAVDLPNDEMVTIATDTGRITTHIMSYLSKSSCVFLEANHDRGMLYRNEKYPWELKQRIKGNYGHLSNEQCLEAIDQLHPSKIKKVVMGHLSMENNCPKLLDQLTTKFINERASSFQPFIATQDDPFSVLIA
jgi:phosphoribosyl 1,2-cyclic phosphodiesterase